MTFWSMAIPIKLPLGLRGLNFGRFTLRFAGNPIASRVVGPRVAAGQIARHAFRKHVVEGGEFLGVRTVEQFATVIDDVMRNATHTRVLSGGRTAYWRDGVVVIVNPSAPGGGTAFVPKQGFEYFLALQ